MTKMKKKSKCEIPWHDIVCVLFLLIVLGVCIGFLAIAIDDDIKHEKAEQQLHEEIRVFYIQTRSRSHFKMMNRRYCRGVCSFRNLRSDEEVDFYNWRNNRK